MARHEHRSWISRNWKWFVPVVCVLPVLLCGGFLALIIGSVFGLIKSSEPYEGALSRAKADAAVIAALGEPIAEGYFPSGNINVSGTSGDADFVIPITGPLGAGTIYVQAIRDSDKWEFTTLEVEIEGSDERINLLAGERVELPR